MARHQRPRALSDDQLLQELVDTIVDILVEVEPVAARHGRLNALSAESRRRQRKYSKLHGPRCTCWVCYRPYPTTIHPDLEGPY